MHYLRRLIIMSNIGPSNTLEFIISWRHPDLGMTFEIRVALKLQDLLHCSYSGFKVMFSQRGESQQVHLNNTVIWKCAAYPQIRAKATHSFKPEDHQFRCQLSIWKLIIKMFWCEQLLSSVFSSVQIIPLTLPNPVTCLALHSETNTQRNSHRGLKRTIPSPLSPLEII